MFTSFVFFVLGCVIGWGVTYYYFKRAESLAQKIAYFQVPRALPKFYHKPVVTQIGSNQVLLGPGQHTNWANISPYTFEISEQGHILVSGDITDTNGAVIGLLRDSSLYMMPGSDYDTNSDESALEVVDEKQYPILQLFKPRREIVQQMINNLRIHLENVTRSEDLSEKLPGPGDDFIKKKLQSTREIIQTQLASLERYGEMLQVSYISVNKNLVAICYDDQTQITSPSELKKYRGKIVRLFEYPGYKRPGVRRIGGS